MTAGGRTSGGHGRPARPDPQFELVLVDGDNLLHRVRGMRDEAGLRWLLPRLRAWRPANATITVMLDGHPDPGEAHRRRVATGVEFRHSGDLDGDSAIVGTLRARPYSDRARTIVVTDDRQLGDRVRHAGGMVRRLDWLVNGLAASVGESAPASGATDRPTKPPIGIGGGQRRLTTAMAEKTSDTDDEDDREPWKPGRGATTKRGNPKKSPKREGKIDPSR
jgi:hypothetical protein